MDLKQKFIGHHIIYIYSTIYLFETFYHFTK